MFLVALTTDAFLAPSSSTLRLEKRAFVSTTFAPLEMAGFGASPSSKKKDGAAKAKKDVKLKPKQQWDRYCSNDLKGCDIVRVAVRVITKSSNKDDDGDDDDSSRQWFETGTVKSKDNAYTPAAVIRHRMLIAEHSRRMFPLQIRAKDQLEWGYSCSTAAQAEGDQDETEWKVAGKVENMPNDIDKLIGFQGLADPSGFYTSSKTATMVDNTASGFQNMKNKGITGHVSLEVHD